MKHEYWWAIGITIVICGAIILQFFTRPNIQNPPPSNASPTEKVPTNTSQKTFTIKEIAQHATQSDCYLLIDGSVYDVTSYIAAHPGGASTIIPNCGTDATKTFSSKDGKGDHSKRAYLLLDEYRIGSFE